MRDPPAAYAEMAATAKKKVDSPWSHQIVQGFLAGAYVGVGALSATLAEAGFPSKEVSSLLGGAVFPNSSSTIIERRDSYE